MFARLSILALAAALAAAPSPHAAASYSLESTGALRQRVEGSEARYGITPERVEGKRELAIALGATTGNGAIVLLTEADGRLEPGRYPVVHSWADSGTAGARRFHTYYTPGRAEHPLGMFHSESGWVTITESTPGRIAGTFELRARGFLASNDQDEAQWVTLRGSFSADGEQQALAVGM
jgi:hypothetical protein